MSNSSDCFIGDLNPVKCEVPPLPTNVQAYPVTSQQIIAYWSKPVGVGYTSKVVVSKGDAVKSSSTKDRGVSPALAEGITGLDADTNYTVSVYLSCTDQKDTFSNAITTTVKTFPTGRVKVF